VLTKATNMSSPPKLGRSWYGQTNIENQIQPKRKQRKTSSSTNTK